MLLVLGPVVSEEVLLLPGLPVHDIDVYLGAPFAITHFPVKPLQTRVVFCVVLYINAP